MHHWGEGVGDVGVGGALVSVCAFCVLFSLLLSIVSVKSLPLVKYQYVKLAMHSDIYIS